MTWVIPKFGPVKVAVIGLPNSGKTTFAVQLATILKAVHFNADDIRNNINKDLGFALEDRLEQARRLGHLCNIVNRAEHHAIADFVCPTIETRQAFNASHYIWLNTSRDTQYADTKALFVPPSVEEFMGTSSKFLSVPSFTYSLANVVDWLAGGVS